MAGVMQTADRPAQFDLGFAITGQPDIGIPLQVAQSVLQGCVQKINQYVTSQVADSAVTADLLLTRIGQCIQQHLGQAGMTAVELEQPIKTQVAGQLGAAMEAALPLGVVPPNPNNLGVMPSAVQIREGALAGDYGPALAAYRETALPFHAYGGMQYAQAMQAIIAALPQDERSKRVFSAAVAAIASNPGAVPGPGSTAPTCDGAVAELAQQLVDQCSAQFPQGGPGLQACLNGIQAQVNAAWAACLGQATGGSGQGAGVGGTPGSTGTPDGTGTGETSGGVPGSPAGTGGTPTGGTAGSSTGAPGTGAPQPAGGTSAPGGGLGGPSATGPAPGSTSPPGQPGGQPGPGGTGGGGGTDSPGGTTSSPPPGVPCWPGGTVGPGGIPPCNPGTGGTPGPGGSGVVAPGGTVAPAGSPSAGGGTTPPSSSTGCDMSAVTGAAQDAINANGSAASVLGAITGTAGVTGAVWQPAGQTCPSGYTALNLDTSGTSMSGQDVCVQCAPPPSSPPPGQCCPVTVNVNCPPAPTAPPPSTPESAPPGQPQPPPPPFAPGVQNQPIAGCDEFGAAPGLQVPDAFQSLSKLYGLRNADGTINIGWLPAGAGQIAALAAEMVVGFSATLTDQLGSIVQSVLNGSGCSDGQQLALIATSLVTQFAGKFFGDTLSGVEVPNRQQRNYRCPTALPDQVTAASAWLANQIDDATLECWTRAAGYRFPEWKKVVDASRQKWNALQLGSLFLRDDLTDDQLKTRLRELGWTQDSDVGELQELLKQIPPASDLVRFMVRDAGDASLVQQFGMDDDFEAKYSEQIKTWAKAQGVSDDYMQYVWRSHWSIPAPTQLFEMLHRSQALPAGDPAAVSIDDVQTALEQQDILPYWIPKLINISYRPLTRIDAKRAFQIGALDVQGLTNAYTDQGYSPENAAVLVDFNQKQNRLALYRLPVVRQYSQGLLTDDQFTAVMQQNGADDDAIQGARDQGLFLADVATRKSCVDSIHRRVLLGDYEQSDVQSDLIGLGVPVAIAAKLNQSWQCELSNRGKAIPTSDLATLYTQGAIDAPGLVERLQRLGYSYEDAVLQQRRIARNNQIRLDAQEAKRVAQQEKQAIADQRSQLAAQRTIKRNLLKQQRAGMTMQRVNVMREKRLIEAGKNLSEHLSLPLGDAVVLAKSTYRSYLSMSTYLPDEIIAAVVTTAATKSVTDAATFQSTVSAILQAGPVGGDVPQADIMLASQLPLPAIPQPPPNAGGSDFGQTPE